MRLTSWGFSRTGDFMTQLKASCPRCESMQSWALGDGRLKCRRCSMRYSWRSVWDGVRLPEQTKQELLEAFVQGVTAYRQRFDRGACIDTRERFYRLARACCALHTSTEASAVHITRCQSTIGRKSGPQLRGWSMATRVVVLAIAAEEGRVRIAPPSGHIPEVVASLRERAAIGSVYCMNDSEALANLQVHGNYVVCQGGRHAALTTTPIEEFWEYASERLQTFRRVPCRFFHLYLGEICFRFNHRGADLSQPLYSLLQSMSMDQAKAVIASKLPQAAEH
jgi:transposase